MAVIGGYTVFSVIMPPDLPGIKVMDDTPPVVPGVEYFFDGVRAEPFQARSIHFLTALQSPGLLSVDLKALQGTVISITDDHLEAYTNLMVEHVQPINNTAQKIVASVPTGYTNRCEFMWRLRGIGY